MIIVITVLTIMIMIMIMVMVVIITVIMTMITAMIIIVKPAEFYQFGWWAPTWSDVVEMHLHVFVSVRPAVLMKEPEGVAELVDDGSQGAGAV